jgi:FkbM family methyltransferase
MTRSDDLDPQLRAPAAATISAAHPDWGRHRPPPAFRLVLAVSQRIPQVPGIKQLAFALRRIGRRLAADPVDVRHRGLRLRLRSRGNISEGTFLYMPGRWDRPERAFLASRLRSGAVFVDVGANAGGYLWWVQHLLGDRWTGVAVEPDPDLAARLRFNLATNGMDHVQLFPVAVGPTDGSARLRVDEENRGQNALVSGAGADVPGQVVDVRVVPLPELLEEAGVTRVDALKIDVEGMEPAILDDFLDRADPALRPGLILMELLDEASHRGLFDRLEAAGYRVALRTRLNVAFVRG